MKCDSLLEETLALPGEISTMTIGRFFNRDSDTMILGKKNVLSIFHYDGLNSTFIFDRHVQTYREVAFIRTSPQSHSLDCLFTLTVNGEWLFLQWNGSFFFPLAAGSLQEAVRPFVGVDHPHRFHVNSVSSYHFCKTSVVPQFLSQSRPNLN
ncbi:hypothetical protein BLNAU_984 [Blattamonas nauphoetae]|uniref:Uncharacterized protein n=1 Tax=Blattamonas nauphoetae TaxID=2049346 RepID=A0ABQ9YJH2_9EUKA|nr:hypothetical protein BLNAU_984 [Blattamonas nauphoetae]